MKTNNKVLSRSLASTILVIGTAFAMVSCSTTHQVRSVKESGFLEDYGQLQKGGEGEAQLIYINPSTVFSGYNKIMIDPIAVYADENSKLAKLPNDDLQALVNYLHATLHDQLGKIYDIVSYPGPETMRLRVALTEAKGSKVVLDTLSSAIPIGIGISALKRVAIGTNASIGQTRVEAEILDSETDERLLAAIDARAGRKYTGKFDKWKKWQDAKDAYDYWAKRLKIRLAKLRAK